MEDAIVAGWTHLRIRCACGRCTDIPWNLLPETLAALRRPIGDFARRLRCTNCKSRIARSCISTFAQSFLPHAWSGGGSKKTQMQEQQEEPNARHRAH